MLLIVEDERDLQEVLVTLLEGLNCEIILANDGQEAIEICQSKVINAILSDINMPRKNGLDLIRELRRQGYETPVVFLSGYGDKEKVTEALRLGAIDFLDKPFQEDLLMNVVNRAINYGLSLEEFNKFFQSITLTANLPQAEIERFREAKKQIWMIRLESDLEANRRTS